MQQQRDLESMQVKTELRRETNWVGAFVIGLAGTILVTGVTGPVDAGLGAMAVPVFFITAIMGVLLCFFLAELAAMFPERTGGSPTYAYPAFLKWPRLAGHVNSFTSWAYWLGWAPVLSVNMLLVGTYIERLCSVTWGVNLSIHPIQIPGVGLPTDLGAILIGGGLAVVLYIAALFGIRLSAAVGIVLAIASGLPLVFLGFAPFIFAGHLVHWSNVLPFTVVGKPFWTAAGISLVFQFFFLTTWNALAMEAAACYVGECADPKSDAPKAIVGEAALGLVIYTMVPLAFLVVLGAKAIQIDPYAMFVTFTGKIFGGSAAVGIVGQWIVSLLLIAALMLSALNAIMGSARSVYQMAMDGDFPHVFAHLNRHGVPDFSMTVNTLMNLGVMFFGGAATIYVFSNVGYLISFVPVLIAFWLLRRNSPDHARPYRLPNWMTPIALVLAVIFSVIWIVGGPLYSFNQGTGAAYFIGWAVLLTYVPLYYYRKLVEDRRAVGAPAEEAPTRFA